MLYLHIGMHKTGTTYMQECVFPRLKGIRYLRRTALDTFVGLDPKKSYLASNERLAGNLWDPRDAVDSSIKSLSELFPDARILMSFRPHEGYIISSYKQYLHEGGTKTLSEYFNPIDDSGFMKISQFSYRARLEAVAKHFGEYPFVFTLREIARDLDVLLKDLSLFLGAEAPDPGAISRSPKNKGVGYYQGELLRRLNRFNRSRFNPGGRWRLDNPVTDRLKIDPARIAQRWLGWLPEKNFEFSEEWRSRLESEFASDWQFVEDIASRRGEHGSTMGRERDSASGERLHSRRH